MHRINQETIDKIIEEYIHNTEKTVRQILQEYEISKPVLYSILNENNIPKRGLEYRPRKTTIDLSKMYCDNNDKYYWLGFLSADGNISKELRSVSIDLNRQDGQHIQNFLDFCGCNANIYYHTNSGGHPAAKRLVCSKELCQYLAKYNIVPNKSLIFEIPEDKIPEQYMSHYIRGLFDGDGCISFNKWGQVSFSFCSGNLKVCEQIKEILKMDNVIAHGSGVYRISCTGNIKAKAIFDYMYQDSNPNNRLARKYEKYLQTLN